MQAGEEIETLLTKMEMDTRKMTVSIANEEGGIVHAFVNYSQKVSESFCASPW
jgi:hypothetical protein